MSDNYLPFKVDLEKLLENLTLDQWASCHLLYYSLLDTYMVTDYKSVNRADVLTYMANASKVICDFVQKTPYNKLSADLNAANDSMRQAVPLAFLEPTEENSALRSQFSSLLNHIVEYCIETFQDKSLKGHFDDVIITPEGQVSSHKAHMTLKDFARKIYKEDKKETKNQPEAEISEEVPTITTDNPEDPASDPTSTIKSEEVSDITPNEASEAALKEVCEVTLKEVCEIAPKEVCEIAPKEVCEIAPKEVCDVATKVDSNQSPEEICDIRPTEASDVSLHEAGEVSAKDDSSIHPKDDSAITTDSTKVDADPLRDLVAELSTDSFFSTSSDLSQDSNYERDSNVSPESGMVNEEDHTSDENGIGTEEEEEETYTYRESWESVRHLWQELPVENALLAHIVNLLLCKRFLEGKIYAKYKKNVIKAMSTFNGSSNPKQKEFALRNANEAFESLKEKVLESLDTYAYYDNETSNVEGLFSLATDLCLDYVESSITEASAKGLLKGVTTTKEYVNVNATIEGYAENIAKEAQAEYGNVRTSDESDDDLEDRYDKEDDKDWENGEGPIDQLKDPFPHMTEICMQNVSRLIKRLDLEQAIMVHVVALKIINGNYPESFYSEYKEDVNKLVSLFRSTGKSSQTLTVQSDTNEAYKDLSRHITILLNRLDARNINPVIAAYAQFDIASYMSLERVFNLSKGYIKNAISDLTFDESKDLYTGRAVESLASQYLELARKGK